MLGRFCIVAVICVAVLGGMNRVMGQATNDIKKLGLPAEVTAIVRAGNGDILLLQMDSLSKAAIFDFKEGKITGYVSLGGNDTLVAGNADSVILLLRDKKILQRWSLHPLEKKLTIALPISDEIDGLAAGYASNAPVLVMGRKGPSFIDATSLKPVKIENNLQNGDWHPHPQYPIRVQASADGSTFAGYVPGISPSGLRTLRLVGNRLVSKYEHESVGMQIPSADGSLLFTAAGIYNSDLRPLGKNPQDRMQVFPTVHPAYYFGVSGNEWNGEQQSISLYATSDRTLLYTFTDLLDQRNRNDMPRPDRSDRSLPLSDRITANPAARKLVMIDESRKSLTIRTLDVVKLLSDRGIDYLFVESLPVTSAKPGQDYEYAIKVLSKSGSVKFTLDSGPTGMTISPDGVLRWKVPAKPEEDAPGVIVTIEDGSGQSIIHAFAIQTATKGVAAPVEIAPGEDGGAPLPR